MDQIHNRGRTTLAQLLAHGEEQLDQIFSAAPALGQLAVGTVYGHLHHRDELDARLRETAALVAIIAAGCTGTSLAVHVRAGLAVGLSPGEIVEILVTAAAYVGFPRAVEALSHIEEALRQAGTVMPLPRTPRHLAVRLLEQAQQDTSSTLSELVQSWPAHEVRGIDTYSAVAVFYRDETHATPVAVAYFRADNDEGVAVTIFDMIELNSDEHGSASQSAATVSAVRTGDDSGISMNGQNDAADEPTRQRTTSSDRAGQERRR